MTETIIEVKSLVKQYGTLRAVDDVSFELSDGEVFAFLGPNGAGKTTFSFYEMERKVSRKE